MRRTIKNFLSDKLYIEMLVATVLFIVAIATNSLMDFIIYMLYFIIFLEIVRAVANYIREQKVGLKLLVDAFIILALREFIVNVVKINDENIATIDELMSSSVNLNIFVLAGVIIFLLVVRFLTIRTSSTYMLKKSKDESKTKINKDD